jgi:hypothetical protein
VFVAFVIRHAVCLRCIVICGLRGCTIFFHIILQMTRFRKKKEIDDKMCVFLYSLQLCLKQTFLIRRRIERYMIKNARHIGLHVKCPLFLSDFHETWIFWTDLLQILKFQISWDSVLWKPRCSLRTDGPIDGQTDMTKLIVAFRSFANAPKHVTGIATSCRSDSVEFQADYIKLLMNARNTMVLQKLTVAEKVKIFPTTGPFEILQHLHVLFFRD